MAQHMSADEQQGLEDRLAAAAACVKGSALIKFVLGRRKRHERFFRVENVVHLTSAQAVLRWGSGGHSGRLLRAEESVGPGLQREQRLSNEELARCFQVVLDGKVLAVMAPEKRVKDVWVSGLNALAAGELMPKKALSRGV